MLARALRERVRIVALFLETFSHEFYTLAVCNSGFCLNLAYFLVFLPVFPYYYA